MGQTGRVSDDDERSVKAAGGEMVVMSANWALKSFPRNLYCSLFFTRQLNHAAVRQRALSGTAVENHQQLLRVAEAVPQSLSGPGS